MTRKEFIQHKSNGTYPVPSSEKNTRISQSNPAFAQSVRDMVYNPLPIIPRPINYFQGPLTKDMHAFDKMYPDKFDAHRAAKEVTEKTTKNLNDLQSKYEKEKAEKGQPAAGKDKPSNQTINSIINY